MRLNRLPLVLVVACLVPGASNSKPARSVPWSGLSREKPEQSKEVDPWSAFGTNVH